MSTFGGLIGRLVSTLLLSPPTRVTSIHVSESLDTMASAVSRSPFWESRCLSPSIEYCDVITVGIDGEACTGETVVVDGEVTVTVPALGAVAFHTGERL